MGLPTQPCLAASPSFKAKSLGAKSFKAWSLAGVALAATTLPALAADATLTIESWRNDDLPIWQEKIIPAFEKDHPGIEPNLQPTAPKDHNAALNSKLEAGTAGDIVACRPFDASLELHKKGQLASVAAILGMVNFGPLARAGWSTDDGRTTFCVPVAAVLGGFIYNEDAFEKVGIAAPPLTADEFFADLDRIEADGTYVPLAMGTPDQWEAAAMGHQVTGPNSWHGHFWPAPWRPSRSANTASGSTARSASSSRSASWCRSASARWRSPTRWRRRTSWRARAALSKVAWARPRNLARFYREAKQARVG